MRRSIRSTILCALLLLGAFAAGARAQIELPAAPPPAAPASGPARAGEGESGYQDPATKGQEPASGGLDLPRAPEPVATPPAAPAPAQPQGIDASPLGNLPASRHEAASFILSELRRFEDPKNPLIDQAAQSLIGLGDDGLEAARRGLMEDRPGVLLASAKVLLSSEKAPDRELVRKRLRSKLPASVAGPLVEAFAALDPVGASPTALAALLDHPLAGARAAASRRLEGLDDPALVPALTQLMGSSRADTRLRAMDLAARFQGAGAVDMLMGRLGDPAAHVAGRAMILLAAREDPAVVDELRRRAFDQPWILRESAYAVLALVEREDARLVNCVDERHVPALLEGLAVSDPFVAGACAAALSGIGFRSTGLGHPEWLDRSVPDRLVRAVSGLEFHNDFSSLQRPAARRLALISGQSFASDGPAWALWWSEARSSFRARRSVIEARPELANSLRVEWRNELEAIDAFRILGPTAKSEPAAADELLRITERQALDLYTLLEQNGVFGPERLPGVRGASNLPGRSLDLGLGSQGKSFRFTGSASEPWFETVSAGLQALRLRNRWQRYPSPARHASAEDLWFEQAAWWDEEHTPLERALRMKSLVLQSLPSMPVERRASGVAELVAIYADPSAAEDADFGTLFALLADEPFYSAQAQALLGLSLAHVNAATPERDRRTEKLVELALERFGERSVDTLEQILRGAGPDVARAKGTDPRPPLRAVAARLLAEFGEPADLNTVQALLEDPSPLVQLAAIESLGKHRVEAARLDLLLRARVAEDPALRSAALWSVAQLGGEGAVDVMVSGLASPLQQVKVAAARGLARLGDPSAAPLLVSLLGQGRGSDLFGPAREGLLLLGPAATSDILRAINTPGHRARREGSILLSQLGEPQAVPVLMALLSENANDSLVASELAVSTCVDLRAQGDPARAWWDWWDSVVHDDANAWLCAALQRLGVQAPDPADLVAPSTRAGMRWLCTVLLRAEPHLVERARRDLGRLIGRDLGTMPPIGEARRSFVAALEQEISQRFPQ